MRDHDRGSDVGAGSDPWAKHPLALLLILFGIVLVVVVLYVVAV